MKLKVAGVALSSALVALTLIGCGGKDDVPSCGSSDVQSQLQEALKKNADELKVQAKVTFKDFTVQKKNQDQRKVICEAKANGYFGQSEMKDEPFRFSAQYTEDNKLLVEILTR